MLPLANEVPAGSASVTVASTASEGPALLTTIWYVTGWPAITGSVTSVLWTVMSALRMTSIVAAAVRAGRSGSGVGDEATTVLVSWPTGASAGTPNVTTTLAVSP